MVWLCIGLALLLCWDASGLDVTLIRLFGTAQGFAWRDHWLASRVLHDGGRHVSVGLFALTTVACLRPFGPWRSLSGAERCWWFCATAFCLVLIPQIKHYSATSCPWDLQEFGGTAHPLSHWRGLWPSGLRDGGPGRCFPSGHASGAFSFLAIGLVLRRWHRAASRRWLIGLAVMGSMFGLAQMARGAHYASHTLYTAWVCWAVTAMSWHALQWRVAAVGADQPGARIHAR